MNDTELDGLKMESIETPLAMEYHEIMSETDEQQIDLSDHIDKTEIKFTMIDSEINNPITPNSDVIDSAKVETNDIVLHAVIYIEQ